MKDNENDKIKLSNIKHHLNIQMQIYPVQKKLILLFFLLPSDSYITTVLITRLILNIRSSRTNKLLSKKNPIFFNS